MLYHTSQLFRGIGIIVSTLIFAGCAPATISHFASDKIVAAYPDGTPMMNERYDADSTIRGEENYTFRQQLDLLEHRFKESGRKQILIYAFGGMNDMAFEVERSEELTRAIWETSDYYPVMLAWESNLFDCYLDHLFFIRQGVDVGPWGVASSPFYFMMDFGRALMRLPVNMYNQSKMMFTTADDFNFTGVSDTTLQQLQNHPMTMYLGEDCMPWHEVWLARFAYFAGTPVRFFTTSLIDWCAGSSLSVMQARARSAFGKYTVLNYNDDQYIESFLHPPKGVYAQLCEQLQKICASDSTIEITLVGHSLGPYIINEVISKYGDKLPIRNIVYMSAVTNVRTVGNVITPYLRDHPEARFYNLTCHPRAEEYEMMCYGVLPQGSALEWITRYFISPVDCDDYAVGLWPVAFACFPRIFSGCEAQVVNKAFGISDPITNVTNSEFARPESHTDFSEPELRFWDPVFWDVPKSRKGKNWLLLGSPALQKKTQ